MDLHDVIAKYQDEKKLHHFEGSSGIQNLCKLLGDMGYHDRMNRMGHYGDQPLGNLVDFLEDNPGAMEAIITWIGDQDNEEWKENLKSELPIEGECEECGAPLETFMKDIDGINLEEVHGCPNCDS
ncbi:hypothetical protein [Nitrospira sp. BLG_2]|uniref:hypothetical protein n=1 Tax=Nitrospira sp. BLG_2 TaxID=3397507 RepID=UPI003B9D8CCE